jgi:hypothetical protein
MDESDRTDSIGEGERNVDSTDSPEEEVIFEDAFDNVVDGIAAAIVAGDGNFNISMLLMLGWNIFEILFFLSGLDPVTLQRFFRFCFVEGQKCPDFDNTWYFLYGFKN